MLGALLSILAALLFGTSTAIQKYRIRKIRKFSVRRLSRDRTWLFSVLVAVFGIVLYMVALSYESITLVQPLMSTSILIPVLAGWVFFDEKIGTKWIHIIFIFVGVILLSV